MQQNGGEKIVIWKDAQKLFFRSSESELYPN